MASALLDEGHQVKTLTNSPRRPNPFGVRVPARPLSFDDPEKLAGSLTGAACLHNTYWVRFNHKQFRHADAVENTRSLFEAARTAGVPRVVHVSITNPSLDSDLEYFRGKAELERALVDSGLSHAILRPAVLFGREDILVNNIAWALRRFPIVGVFGAGQYRIQPIYAGDLARLAVEHGQRSENVIVDAIGPETFTFRELVRAIGEAIGRPRRIVSVPPGLAYLFAKIVGWFVGDVFLTREEISALMRGLLATGSPPAGHTKLTEWAEAHSRELGRRYANELARRLDRSRDYAPTDR
jgi:NADH dehydrogenase